MASMFTEYYIDDENTRTKVEYVLTGWTASGYPSTGINIESPDHKFTLLIRPMQSHAEVFRLAFVNDEEENVTFSININGRDNTEYYFQQSATDVNTFYVRAVGYDSDLYTAFVTKQHGKWFVYSNGNVYTKDGASPFTHAGGVYADSVTAVTNMVAKSGEFFDNVYLVLFAQAFNKSSAVIELGGEPYRVCGIQNSPSAPSFAFPIAKPM